MSFTAGIVAGLVFWLLRTPTPVPPLIELVGLLAIAVVEIVTGRALLTVRRRRERRPATRKANA